MLGSIVCAVAFSPALMCAWLSRRAGWFFPAAFILIYAFLVFCGYDAAVARS